MEMTQEEIVKRYKEAKDQRKQISILADLNACKQNDIIDVLTAAGVVTEAKKRGPKPGTKQHPLKERKKQEKAVNSNKEIIQKLRDANRKLLEDNKKLEQRAKEAERLSATLESECVKAAENIPEFVQTLVFDRLEQLNATIVGIEQQLESINETKKVYEEEYKQLAEYIAPKAGEAIRQEADAGQTA